MNYSDEVALHSLGQVLMCGRSRDWFAFDLHSGAVHKLRGASGRAEEARHET